MTITKHTEASTRSRAETPSKPRSATSGWSALREDLLSGALAHRPLPPADSGPVARWAQQLPGGLGRGLRWLPHVLIMVAAVVLFVTGLQQSADFGAPPDTLFNLSLMALMAAPVALVLSRPAAAYWLSLLGLVVSVPLGVPNLAAPRSEVAMVCHLLVLVLVVLRTRPRVAAEMWLITTVVFSALAGAVTGSVGSAVAALATYAGLLLVAAAAVRAWWQERQHVVETESVTARERSRRTLLEERNTIARELHDVVAHHMSVIAIQAQAAPYRVAETPPELATSFATIRENAVAALTELRRILGVVRAEDPDGCATDVPQAPQPTLADLDALLDSVRTTGLAVDSEVTGEVRPLSQGMELSAYRIVQEALSNTLRHAPGAAARVELGYVPGGLKLRIVNGAPDRAPGAAESPTASQPGAGHGLLGMRERVQVLGGELSTGATAAGGFEVTAFLPTGPTEGIESMDAPEPLESVAPSGSAGSGGPARGNGSGQGAA